MPDIVTVPTFAPKEPGQVLGNPLNSVNYQEINQLLIAAIAAGGAINGTLELVNGVLTLKETAAPLLTNAKLQQLAQAMTATFDARYMQLGGQTAVTLTNFSFASPPASAPAGTTVTFSLLGTFSNGTNSTVTSGTVWSADNGYTVPNGALAIPANAVVGSSITVTAVNAGITKSHTLTVAGSGEVTFVARRYDVGAPSGGSTYAGITFLNDSEIHQLPAGNAPNNYGNTITNTASPGFYQSLRYGSDPYRAQFNNVPAGNYTLHMYAIAPNNATIITTTINGVNQDIELNLTSLPNGDEDRAVIRSYNFTQTSAGAVVFDMIKHGDTWVICGLELVAQGVAPSIT